MLSTAYEIFENQDFKQRILVAITCLRDSREAPDSWYYNHGLKLACTPAFIQAWEKKKKNNPYHSRLGYDPTVISDEMITTAIKETLKLSKEA